MLEAGLMEKWLRDTLLEHEHLAFLRRERKQQNWKLNISLNEEDDDDKQQRAGPALSKSNSEKMSMAQLEAENIHNFRIDELESVFFLYLCGNAIALIVFLLQISWINITDTHIGF